jgi:hypothetical protein
MEAKLSETGLPGAPTAGATALAERVKSVPLAAIDNIVVPAGIPAPLTSVPTVKPVVDGRETVAEPSVTVPLVSVKVSGTAPDVATAGSERVKFVLLTMVAIVVPGCIPAPLTAVPTISPAGEGIVTAVVVLTVVPV